MPQLLQFDSDGQIHLGSGGHPSSSTWNPGGHSVYQVEPNLIEIRMQAFHNFGIGDAAIRLHCELHNHHSSNG